MRSVSTRHPILCHRQHLILKLIHEINIQLCDLPSFRRRLSFHSYDGYFAQGPSWISQKKNKNFFQFFIFQRNSVWKYIWSNLKFDENEKIGWNSKNLWLWCSMIVVMLAWEICFLRCRPHKILPSLLFALFHSLLQCICIFISFPPNCKLCNEYICFQIQNQSHRFSAANTANILQQTIKNSWNLISHRKYNFTSMGNDGHNVHISMVAHSIF